MNWSNPYIRDPRLSLDDRRPDMEGMAGPAVAMAQPQVPQQPMPPAQPVAPPPPAALPPQAPPWGEFEPAPAQPPPQQNYGRGAALGAVVGGLQGFLGKPVDTAFWSGSDLAEQDRQGRYLALQEGRDARAVEAQQRQERMQDPTSPESRAVQQRLGVMFPNAPPGTFDGVTAADMSSGDLVKAWMEGDRRKAELADDRAWREGFSNRESARDFEDATKRAEMRGKRKGGGYGAPAAPVSPESIDAQASALVNAGIAPEAIAGLVEQAKMPGKRGDQARQKLLQQYMSTATASGKRETAQGEQDRAHRIPGWTRDPDAPALESAERRDLRSGVAAFQKMRGIVRQMNDLASKITPDELAAAKAGKDTANTALARQLQRSMTTQLRIIANMGVPSLTEMAVVNEQAPELTTLEGFLNAPARFSAIETDMGGQLEAEMLTYGYRPESRGGGMETRTYRVIKDGKVIETRKLAEPGVVALQNRGFSVEPVQ